MELQKELFVSLITNGVCLWLLQLRVDCTYNERRNEGDLEAGLFQEQFAQRQLFTAPLDDRLREVGEARDGDPARVEELQGEVPRDDKHDDDLGELAYDVPGHGASHTTNRELLVV